ncbi:MAG: apolipoprotein N-acyltransferase [Deltaproteobacteria bacterium]|jgi:apolipoprotein N-acyltransferase|nr:apolipoprotein N-acyltransferase [Deltaproteobacteria bacterium]
MLKIKALFHFTPRELFLILLGGLGFFLGFPNSLFQIPPLVLLFPFALACLALEAESEGKAAAGVITLLTAGGLPAAFWLTHPLVTYGGVPMPLAVVFIIILAVCVSAYYIVFALFLRFFRARAPLLALPAAACAWGALEYARGLLFTGITWFSLSSAMAGWPLWAQGASLFGMFGLSSVYAFTAFSFIPLLPRGRRGGLRKAPEKIKTLTLPLLGCSLLAALLAYGQARLKLDFTEGRPVLIAQVQGNIDQAQKWLPAKQMQTVRHYAALSEKAIELSLKRFGKNPDLLVWPETSMPFYFSHAPNLGALLRDLSKRHGLPLLFGAPESDRPPLEARYNRVWLLDEQGREAGYYDKEHLVPFGEYLPLGLNVPFAGEFIQGMGFTPGTAETPLRYRHFAFGVLICYESLFPELAQARVESGSNLLLNLSNDAWFGDSPAPWQILQLSAMRAIEQGRYMLRSTNTGASAMIDPAGRIQGLGPLFRDYPSVHQAWLLEEKTFFNRYYARITKIVACSPLFFLALLGLRPVFRTAIRHKKRERM